MPGMIRRAKISQHGTSGDRERMEIGLASVRLVVELPDDTVAARHRQRVRRLFPGQIGSAPKAAARKNNGIKVIFISFLGTRDHSTTICYLALSNRAALLSRWERMPIKSGVCRPDKILSRVLRLSGGEIDRVVMVNRPRSSRARRTWGPGGPVAASACWLGGGPPPSNRLSSRFATAIISQRAGPRR